MTYCIVYLNATVISCYPLGILLKSAAVEGGLNDKGNVLVIRKLPSRKKPLYIIRARTGVNSADRVTHYPDNLGVSPVSENHHRFRRSFRNDFVDFRNEGAGRVDNLRAQLRRLDPGLRRNSV